MIIGFTTARSRCKIQLYVRSKVSADTSQLDDAMKETLDKIKEEINDIFDQIEHKIYLLEKNNGDP